MRPFERKSAGPLRSEDVRLRYNSTIKEVYDSKYEFARWFKTPALRGQYAMMRETIEKRVMPQHIGSYLEVGPGPGTWTKVFLEKFTSLSCDLVDISSEMLAMARANLSEHKTVNFVESDITAFMPPRTYDFFFSSRAIEYVPDKEALMSVIHNALKAGGQGAIITKMPKYLRYRLTGRTVSSFHSGQIAPKQLHALLMKAGLQPLSQYPAIVVVPLLRSAFLNRVAWRLLSTRRLNSFSGFFSEAYCITFEKPQA